LVPRTNKNLATLVGKTDFEKYDNDGTREVEIEGSVKFVGHSFVCSSETGANPTHMS
jgi:hypothetical protein